MLLVKNEIPWHVLTIKQYNINFYWLGAMQIYKQFSWTFFNIARADSLAQKLQNHDTFIIIIHTIQQPVYSIINNIYIFRLNGINHTRSKDRVKANKSIGISCFRFHTNYYYFTEEEEKKKNIDKFHQWKLALPDKISWERVELFFSLFSNDLLVSIGIEEKRRWRRMVSRARVARI